MPEETVTVSTPPPAGAPAASAAASVSLPKAGDGAPPATPPAFAVPDTYKDRPWAKGIDSLDKLWAMNDGAQKLIGERPAGIPGENATPEELNKFYAALGRPETPDKYVFDYGKNADGTPKGPQDAEIDLALKKMLHEEGISAKQASGLQKKFDALAQSIIQKKGLAEQAINQEFDRIGKELYGAEYDKMVARVSPLLKEFTHPKLQPGLAKLTPEALAIVSSIVDNIRAKFIKAGGAPGSQPGGTGPTGTRDSLMAEGRGLMASEAYTNAFHAEHEKVVSRVAEIYRQAAAIR